MIKPMPKEALIRMYAEEYRSVQEIAEVFGCSVRKVYWWLDKYAIRRNRAGGAVNRVISCPHCHTEIELRVEILIPPGNDREPKMVPHTHN